MRVLQCQLNYKETCKINLRATYSLFFYNRETLHFMWDPIKKEAMIYNLSTSLFNPRKWFPKNSLFSDLETHQTCVELSWARGRALFTGLSGTQQQGWAPGSVIQRADQRCVYNRHLAHLWRLFELCDSWTRSFI